MKHMGLGLMVLAALAGGCYDGDFGAARFQCGSTSDCPAGYACVAGCCGGACPDAAPDAGAAPRTCPVGTMWSAKAAACVPGLPGMVQVPGGTFTMGQSGTYPDEAPPRSVSLNTIFLDRTEVTVAAYRLCKAPGCSTPGTGGLCTFGAQPGSRDSLPVNCVSQRQARAYCEWASKRLPTEAEWEYAARGTASSVYPWGSAAPVAPAQGLPQLCWQQGSPCPAGAYGDTLLGQPAEAGTALADLAGNLWEWTSTVYCDYATGKQCNGFYVLRGGAFNRTDPGDVRAARRNATPAEAQPSDAGFRCARDP